MKNTIVIYRPYVDIYESVDALEPNSVYHTGKLHTYIAIYSILGRLGLINYPDKAIDNNNCLQFYWNDGKPYLHDLYIYYNYARELWLEHLGLPTDFISPKVFDILEACEYIDNESNWNSTMATTHQLFLLQKNRFWYKRKFRDIRNLQLKDSEIFIDGKPRRIRKSEIKKETFKIREEVD